MGCRDGCCDRISYKISAISVKKTRAITNNTECVLVTIFCDDGEKIGCILRLNTEYRKFEQRSIYQIGYRYWQIFVIHHQLSEYLCRYISI